MKREYRTRGKMHVGPGGMACPCCNPLNCRPSKAKPLIRRYFRRKAKQSLKNEGTEDAA